MWKNLRDLLFGGITSKILLGISNIFLIKVLIKSDFALLSNFLYIQSMVSGLLFTPFLLAAVPVAKLKKIQNHNRFFSALNWFQMGFLSLLLFAAWVFGPSLSVSLFKKEEFYPSILLGLVASIFMTFQNILLSQQQTLEAYRRFNILSIARPFALILVLLGLHFTGNLNFWSASLSFLVSIISAIMVEFVAFSSLFSLKGIGLRINQFSWFWKSAWMLILFFFIRGTYDHIGFFFVSRFFNMENIANYSVPFRYYSMADLIIVTSHIPFISSFTTESRLESLGRYKKWIKYTSIISVFALAILPFSKEIFVAISGEQYEISFPYFCILMVGLVPFLCFSPAIYGVIAKGMGKFLLILSLISLVVHFGLSWYGAISQNLALISFSTVFSRGLIYIISAFVVFRKL